MPIVQKWLNVLPSERTALMLGFAFQSEKRAKAKLWKGHSISHTDGYTRPKILTLAAGASVIFTFDPAFAASSPSKETGGNNMSTRGRPFSSTEPLPVVGLGAPRGWDVQPPGTLVPGHFLRCSVGLFQKERGGADRQLADAWARLLDRRCWVSIHRATSPWLLASKVSTHNLPRSRPSVKQSIQGLTDRPH